MVRFLKNVLRRSRVKPSRTEQPIQGMSLEEVIAQIKSLGESPLSPVHIALLTRLYSIALLDNHVPAGQRDAAHKLSKAFEADLEAAAVDSPEWLTALRNTTRSVEENAAIGGVGSLRWKLEEESIPPAEFIPYIMRPEHDLLIPNFLKIVGREPVAKFKPLYVKCLIRSREYRGANNAVILLHALATRGDKATAAIFTVDEHKALVAVPDDYAAGRRILVELGLLPSVGNLNPLTPSRNEDVVFVAVSITLNEWDKMAQCDARLENIPENHRSAVLLALVFSRKHLTCRILQQLYGSHMSARVTAIFKDNDVIKGLKLFDETVQALNKAEPGSPMDFALFIAVLRLGGIDPQVEEEYERDRHWINQGAQWLNHERAVFLEYLRFLLRRLSGASPTEALVGTNEEIVKILRETNKEKSSYSEDRIETEA
jgi:hypothetical protein